MEEEKIKLLVIEKTEELHERRANKSFWRSAIASIIVLPVAYFGIQSMAENAAKSAAENALKDQQTAWSSVFSEISQDAQKSSLSAKSAENSAKQLVIEVEKVKNEAHDAKTQLINATSNLSNSIKFKDKSEVIKALMKTAEVKSAIESASKLSINSCREVSGGCGTGMFGQPTYYFDRVSFSCPNDAPIMKSFRFARCGQIGSGNEGLNIIATCCNLVKK